MFNLSAPENAYMFGLFQSDGHLSKNTRNRGKLTLCLKNSDLDILHKIQKLLPVKSSIYHRCRDTNFKKNYHSNVLNVFDRKFRTELNELGMPYGRKSEIIKPPTVQFSKPDYLRGLIDGDGSLGMAKNNRPFVSFITSSDDIADYYRSVQEQLTGKECSIKRNKRDNIYCFTCFMESAQTISSYLYYDGCLSLSRKYLAAQNIIAWKRPANIKRRTKTKRWSQEQDQFIINNTIKESINQLDRTESSIKNRLWCLKKR